MCICVLQALPTDEYFGDAGLHGEHEDKSAHAMEQEAKPTANAPEAEYFVANILPDLTKSQVLSPRH